MVTGKLNYTLKVRVRWWARLIFLFAPVLRHLPGVRKLAVWAMRRGTFLNGERMDRLHDRLQQDSEPRLTD